MGTIWFTVESNGSKVDRHWLFSQVNFAHATGVLYEFDLNLTGASFKPQLMQMNEFRLDS